MNTDKDPIIATIHFGNSPENVWLLSLWLHHFRKAMPSYKRKPVLLTDWNTYTDPIFNEFEISSLPCRHQQYEEFLRPHIPMDLKELIALEGMIKWAGFGNAFLIVDSDAMFQGNPLWHMDEAFNPGNRLPVAESRSFGMARDPYPRFASLGVLERNAGVLYFPEHAHTEMIEDFYKSAWRELRDVISPKFRWLLGQKAWSVTHHKTGGIDLPDICNWSRVWPVNTSAKIVHYHGPDGKMFLRLHYAQDLSPIPEPTL